MVKSETLFLYEEIMLLALRDEEGTIATGYSEYVVAGAMLAELLLDRHISVEDTRKQLVDLQNNKPTGDPINSGRQAADIFANLGFSLGRHEKPQA